VDSHKELPVDDRPARALEARDFVPFCHAVEHYADMIMTAHVLYPSLDPDYPATLSPAIIDGILRRSMGYDRVVVTDDLDMGAVAQHHAPDESALMALKAGVDVLMFCNDPEKAFAARSRLSRAISDREISETRIQQSLRRIRELKEQYAGSLIPCNLGEIREHFRVARQDMMVGTKHDH
jgi:beta-glucosidase-like glycosyl hydrolase